MHALVLALLAAVVPVAACAAPVPARRDVVIGIAGEPRAILDGEPNAELLAAAVTESLVRRDERDEYAPRLAAAVPSLERGSLRVVTDDPAAPAGRLVALFQLRDGLTWQDGVPLTAADAVFAWQQDRLAAPGTVRRWVADRVLRMEALSPDQLLVSYAADERWDAWPLAPRVLPRHRLERATAAERAAYEREPVHAGPFAVAAWIRGYGLTLSAFDGYALGRPALGRIEVRFLPDRSAVLEALRRGEIDVAPSAALEADVTATLDRIADGSERSVSLAYYKSIETIEMLRFATRGQRFSDVRVRRAVELAIGRQKIVDQLLGGRSRVPDTYLVPPLWAADVAGPPVRPDRETAHALLAAAGFTKGQFGILERDGLRMIFPILVAAGSPVRLEAARMVAGDLAAVGIAAEVRELPAADVEAHLVRGDYDLAMVPERADDPRAATDRWLGLADPWFDVLARASRTGDRVEQRLVFVELQRLWSASLPGLPLFQGLAVDVAPRILDGVQQAPSGVPITWNAGAWRFRGSS